MNKHKLAVGSSTRLMGANVFFNVPGAVLTVTAFHDQELLVKIWDSELKRLIPALGWQDSWFGHKVYSQGIRFAISAPVDLLLLACDVLEFVWDSVISIYAGNSGKTTVEIQQRFMAGITATTNLVYREVHSIALAKKLNVFSDGKKVVIGSGKYAYIVPIAELKLETIPWDKIKEVPTVLVTGTNGKTTTVRLTAFLVNSIGKKAGYCSSDWVMVGNEIVEEGDLSGPHGNQSVMVHPEVEVAVLEVARGGLLRRGILTNFVTAATVTNITEDHLGEDGVDNIYDLAEAKSLIYQAVAATGHVVVNLDDLEMRKKILALMQRKIFVTQHINVPELAELLPLAEYICHAKDGGFYWRENGQDQLIVSFTEVPITVNGFAKHNIENTLHAISLAYTLGLTLEQIRNGLIRFVNSAENNRGRANVFEVNGGIIIVDFAHNMAGMSAILNLAKFYLIKRDRLIVVTGNTGNRRNLAAGICQAIVDAKANLVIIKEMKKYLRGAEVGQLPQQMQGLFLTKGMGAKQIMRVEDEQSALDYLIENIKANEVCVFCCHEDAGLVIDKLSQISK